MLEGWHLIMVAGYLQVVYCLGCRLPLAAYWLWWHIVRVAYCPGGILTLVAYCLGGILSRGVLSPGACFHRWQVVSRWHIVSGHIVSGHIVSGGTLSGWHIVSGHIVPGHVVSGHVVSGHHVPPPYILMFSYWELPLKLLTLVYPI